MSFVDFLVSVLLLGLSVLLLSSFCLFFIFKYMVYNTNEIRLLSDFLEFLNSF